MSQPTGVTQQINFYLHSPFLNIYYVALYQLYLNLKTE